MPPQIISLIFPAKQLTLAQKLIPQIKKNLSPLYQLEAICLVDDQQKNLPLPSSQLKILRYPIQRFGKGFALCYGFNHSQGKYIFFWDGNFSFPSSQLLLFINLLNLLKADIVIGSKRHPLSQVHYPRFRHLTSFLYQALLRFLFGLKTTDTQVGLKLYRRSVLETVIPKIIIKNHVFDLEILVVAQTLGYKSPVEAPIKINRFFYKKPLLSQLTLSILKETAGIFYRQKILRYYEQKFD